jgi:hypothetical protein
MMKKEHLSTDTHPKSKEEKLDNQLRDSFPPAIHPPSLPAPSAHRSAARAAQRVIVRRYAHS